MAVSAAAQNTSLYKVPYEVNGRSYVTSMYLSLPIERVAKPWAEFRQMGRAGDADRAFTDLLAAVYDGRYAAAERLVVPGDAVQQRGGIQGYVEAFRRTLPKPEALTILGRLRATDAVWFIVQDTEHHTLRAFTFRRNGVGYRFDESKQPDSVEMLMLSVLRNSASMDLEPGSGPPSNARLVTLPDALTPHAQLALPVVKMALSISDRNASVTDMRVRFYRQCRFALQDGRTQEFFSCHGSGEAERLSQAFKILSPPRAQAFAAFYDRPLELDYVIDGGSVVILLLKDGATGTPQHQDILTEGGLRLVDPMHSVSPLGSLLDSRSFREALDRTMSSSRR